MLVLLAASTATCAFDETAALASTAAEYHSRCYKFVGSHFNRFDAAPPVLPRRAAGPT